MYTMLEDCAKNDCNLKKDKLANQEYKSAMKIFYEMS